jgi:hypothetical protein
MKYRFNYNGYTIEREGARSAKRFATSVPPDTQVEIFEGSKLIDKCRVEDIWNLPNESYQKKLNRKIHKK